MSEIERKAREAWALMTRPVTPFTTIAGEHPLPPGLALDYVQEVTGERDDAVTALIRAGADWLDEQTQPGDAGEVGNTCIADARVATMYLRGESFGMAAVYLSHIRDRCERAADPQVSGHDKWAAHKWNMWLKKAAHALDWCKTVVAAAYPDAKPAGAA